jgi:hypothetical protein
MHWVALIVINWIVIGFTIGAFYGHVIARHQLRVGERRPSAAVMMRGSAVGRR